MTTLTPEREAEIRRDVELECASPTEAMLLAAFDATRAELAEVRAERDAHARDLAMLAEVRAAAQAFHVHEDAGAVEAMLTSQNRNSEAYGLAWGVLRLLRGEGP